jgi:hypothetical protein
MKRILALMIALLIIIGITFPVFSQGEKLSYQEYWYGGFLVYIWQIMEYSTTGGVTSISDQLLINELRDIMLLINFNLAQLQEGAEYEIINLRLKSLNRKHEDIKGKFEELPEKFQDENLKIALNVVEQMLERTIEATERGVTIKKNDLANLYDEALTRLAQAMMK